MGTFVIFNIIQIIIIAALLVVVKKFVRSECASFWGSHRLGMESTRPARCMELR